MFETKQIILTRASVRFYCKDFRRLHFDKRALVETKLWNTIRNEWKSSKQCGIPIRERSGLVEWSGRRTKSIEGLSGLSRRVARQSYHHRGDNVPHTKRDGRIALCILIAIVRLLLTLGFLADGALCITISTTILTLNALTS